MSKTDVLLIKNVVNLGGESDQVKVSAGYARNYLLPQGLAVPLSLGNKRRIEVLRQRRTAREAQEFNTMSELGKSLAHVTINLTVKTGDDGKMFGSVTSGTIADALKTQLDVALDKKKIHLNHPIHTLGDHEVELRLHPEVKVPLKIVLKSSNPLPEIPTPGTAEAPKTEKRSTRHGAQRKPEDPAAVEKVEPAERAPKSDKSDKGGKPNKGPKA